MNIQQWYFLFLWLPPIVASMLLFRSFKDDHQQVLSPKTIRNRLVFFAAIVLLNWTITAWLRYIFYQQDSLTQHFLPPEGTLYYQIIFNRLLVKLGLDLVAGIVLGVLFHILKIVSRGRWVGAIEIWTAVFGGFAVGWEYAIYFLLTAFVLTFAESIHHVMVGKTKPITLAPSLLVSGAIWAIIAAYQHIYILGTYQ